MQDELLLSFARNEGDSLTHEAHQALRNEIIRRNLEWPEKIRDNQANHSFPDWNTWQMVIEQTESGKPVEWIRAELMLRELTEEQASLIMDRLPLKLKELVHKNEQSILNGTLLFTAGLAVTFLPINPQTHLVVFIFAWVSILMGIARFLHGLFYKRKYKRIEHALSIQNSQTDTEQHPPTIEY